MSLTLGTLLSGLQMGAQLFGLIPGMQTQAQNINPYTADFYNQLQTALESAQTQQAQYQGQAAGAADRLGDIAGSQQRTANEISRIEQPSANAWFDQWLQNVPEYQNVARQVSEQATQQLGRSLEEQAKLQTQQALSQVANQFAGQGFSGAAAKAAGAGAAAPITQAQSALAGEQANLFGNTFNQQAGLGQNLASQGQQNQFMNALNALSQQLAGQQTAAGSVAQQGNLYSQNAAQQGNMLANIYGQLGNIAAPQIQQGTTSNPADNILGVLNSMFNIAQNPDSGFNLGAQLGGSAPAQSNYTPSMSFY